MEGLDLTPRTELIESETETEIGTETKIEMVMAITEEIKIRIRKIREKIIKTKEIEDNKMKKMKLISFSLIFRKLCILLIIFDFAKLAFFLGYA